MTYNTHGLLRLASLVCALTGAFPVLATDIKTPVEERFETLQIGTEVYTNVTVTTKAKSYIFISHSRGLANFKVSTLPQDARVKLGYEAPPPPKMAVVESTNTVIATALVNQTLTRIDRPEAKKLGEKVSKALGPEGINADALLKSLKGNSAVLILLVVIPLVIYLFYSYCLMLICRKAGKPGGFLVWVPVLQIIPRFQAADMSGWWFLALPIPLLNLVPLLMWPFKIAAARGKGVLTAIFLLLPVTNVFAFLYLAFSDGDSGQREQRHVEVMTLEAA